MTNLFIQQSYDNSSGVNIYPDDIRALRWLSLTIAKFCQWSVIRDSQGRWVGLTTYTSDDVIINKIIKLYDNEKNADIPAWSPSSRETNMKMSSGYRDFVGKQSGDTK